MWGYCVAKSSVCSKARARERMKVVKSWGTCHAKNFGHFLVEYDQGADQINKVLIKSGCRGTLCWRRTWILPRNSYKLYEIKFRFWLPSIRCHLNSTTWCPFMPFNGRFHDTAAETEDPTRLLSDPRGEVWGALLQRFLLKWTVFVFCFTLLPLCEMKALPQKETRRTRDKKNLRSCSYLPPGGI